MKYYPALGPSATIEQLRGTLRYLDYLRRFLASGLPRAKNPGSRGDSYFKPTITREEGALLLRGGVVKAIRLRAGQDIGNGDKFYQSARDQRRLEDIRERRVRVYQFETRAVRERFGHLLSRYDD